jgi:hypothetical protein
MLYILRYALHTGGMPPRLPGLKPANKQKAVRKSFFNADRYPGLANWHVSQPAGFGLRFSAIRN